MKEKLIKTNYGFLNEALIAFLILTCGMSARVGLFDNVAAEIRYI
jgi:hypothetical protein